MPGHFSSVQTTDVMPPGKSTKLHQLNQHTAGTQHSHAYVSTSVKQCPTQLSGNSEPCTSLQQLHTHCNTCSAQPKFCESRQCTEPARQYAVGATMTTEIMKARE
jgi:hypothetical protein